MSSPHMAAAAHDDASLTAAGAQDLDMSSDKLSSGGDQAVASQYSRPDTVTDPGVTAVNGSHSQPMMATASSSTLADNAGQPESSPGTPDPGAMLYGTRSRNRVVARPNYAEDRDVDPDLETTANSSKNNAPKRMSSLNQNENYTSTPASVHDKAPAVSTRRAQTAANSTAKEAIPGTSTFSANPNAVVGSKKRKQPGSNQTVQASAAPNGTTSSKSFVASASQSDRSRISNMMTFDKSDGYLKNGKLKADDGTVLSANGA